MKEDPAFTGDKNYSWVKVSGQIHELDFAPNNIAVTSLEGRKICIGKFNDSYFAFAFQCPHAGGILSAGYIDGLGNVVCPVHGYRYNIRNGRNVSGEGYYLKTWPVLLRNDGVYVGIDHSDLFGNF